jgi:2-amino-4-hydroxy-6-hydroxymethyldihydropteridine diphosphokinase
MNQAYLIIGSNIDPELNIPVAVKILSNHPDINVQKISSVWKTRSVGSRTNDFLNAAVCLSTPLDKNQLKQDVLSAIEEQMGRIRFKDKFAPRTIDLDIVIFNDRVVDENLFTHDYLILPFSEILPDLVSPSQGITMKQLAKAIKPFSSARIFKIDLPPFTPSE